MGLARSWEQFTLPHRAITPHRLILTVQKLLHSFYFSRAIDEFKVALEEDGTCTIAYWGIALSDWGNPFAPGIIDKRLLQLGRESAEHGERLGAKTERERAYIAAVKTCTGTSKYAATSASARLSQCHAGHGGELSGRS